MGERRAYGKEDRVWSILMTHIGPSEGRLARGGRRGSSRTSWECGMGRRVSEATSGEAVC